MEIEIEREIVSTILCGANSLSPSALLHCNLKAGDLHFCKKRGKTKCCFENEKCEKDWNTINDKVRNKWYADVTPYIFFF